MVAIMNFDLIQLLLPTTTQSATRYVHYVTRNICFRVQI